ncbi:hypothetical protein [Bosea sp. CS1GBMeth4]|uniref:hypothetical protein n=1 Tax=Bosea sp. CS1GBMeth4 TaxID=1892849 RepID=UPI0016444DC3|nr:hypothetical protein [Bosea sp. CS1GBMeth4]
MCCISFMLAACGVTAPRLDLSDDSAEAAALFAQSVTVHVHCELRNAVVFTYDKLRPEQDVEWLKEWAAKITLTINVDEKIGLSPGLALTKFFRSYSNTLRGGELITASRSAELGIGGGLSSTATREQEITWFLVFRDLLDERQYANAKCDQKHPFLMEGDLKIKETLFSGVFAGSLARNTSDPFERGGRLQVVQHLVSFFIEASGNVTPSWRFVDVTANGGGSFFSLNRNRKDTLLITMGPTQLADSGRKLRETRVIPSQSVDSSHLARQIGTSVGANLIGIR